MVKGVCARCVWGLRGGRGEAGRRFCDRSKHVYQAMRGARGRERVGPTRLHPEPGRDPAQRRRVLPRRRGGRRGRRGRPASSDTDGFGWWRGVEQWQLVGLITQRSEVRILPPLPGRPRDERSRAGCSRSFLRLTPNCVDAVLLAMERGVPRRRRSIVVLRCSLSLPMPVSGEVRSPYRRECDC